MRHRYDPSCLSCVRARSSARRGVSLKLRRHPSNVIWDFNPEVFPLSTSSNAATLRALLSAAGVTLTRASSATVQTSASTVVTTGIGVDDPRVGSNGVATGLVLEEERTNVAWRSASLTTSPWGKVYGTETFAADAATCPDGTTNGDRVTAPGTLDAGTFQGYTGFTSQAYTGSVWAQRATGSDQTYRIRLPNVAGTSNQYSPNLIAGSSWSRNVFTASVTSGTSSSSFLFGAQTGLAYDVLLWGSQLEAAAFGSELIETAGTQATRAADQLQLSLSKVQQIVNQGRISLEIDFTPKGARTAYGAAPCFFAHDGGNYAIWSPGTGAITIAVGGASFGTTGVSWNAGDRVRVFIAVGAGVSEIWTKVNSAAAVNRSGGSAMGNFPKIAAIDLMNYLSGQQTAAWIHRIRAWRFNSRPAWAA